MHGHDSFQEMALTKLHPCENVGSFQEVENDISSVMDRKLLENDRQKSLPVESSTEEPGTLGNQGS